MCVYMCMYIYIHTYIYIYWVIEWIYTIYMGYKMIYIYIVDITDR